MAMKDKLSTLIVTLSILVAACGGEGSGDSNNEGSNEDEVNTDPYANALGVTPPASCLDMCPPIQGGQPFFNNPWNFKSIGSVTMLSDDSDDFISGKAVIDQHGLFWFWGDGSGSGNNYLQIVAKLGDDDGNQYSGDLYIYETPDGDEVTESNGDISHFSEFLNTGTIELDMSAISDTNGITGSMVIDGRTFTISTDDPDLLINPSTASAAFIMANPDREVYFDDTLLSFTFSSTDDRNGQIAGTSSAGCTLGGSYFVGDPMHTNANNMYYLHAIEITGCSDHAGTYYGRMYLEGMTPTDVKNENYYRSDMRLFMYNHERIFSMRLIP